MDASEEDLFRCMVIGIMFRMGFQALLTTTARQMGPDAQRWLAKFEQSVIADAKRMTMHESASHSLREQTLHAAIEEFEQVFADVRAQLERDRSGRRLRARQHLKWRMGKVRRPIRVEPRRRP